MCASARAAGCATALALALVGTGAAPPAPADPVERSPVAPPLPADREWNVLEPPAPDGDLRPTLRAAGEQLGDWTIHVAGLDLDGARLQAWSEAPDPLLRHVREDWGRGVDLPDLLRFLDDVLAAGRDGRRGERFLVTPSRARNAGILLHPEEVFGERRARRYGEAPVPVDPPQPPRRFVPAPDGAPLGPRWSARFPNPEGEEARLAALERSRPGSDFAGRLRALMAQLRDQGARVQLSSTVRSRARGYLMWGAFELSRADDAAAVEARVATLADRNARWGLEVPIRWRHADGWRATREAARRMADAYDVVFATEAGARESRHYEGVAADLSVTHLPRRLRLRSPAGAEAEFDLAQPEEPRELSLTPRVIDWLEAHWGLRKLRSDYPHWEDARGP